MSSNDHSAIRELIDYCKDVEDEYACDGDGSWDGWQSDKFYALIANAEKALQSIVEGDDG